MHGLSLSPSIQGLTEWLAEVANISQVNECVCREFKLIFVKPKPTESG